jgi:hypothetical protein
MPQAVMPPSWSLLTGKFSVTNLIMDFIIFFSTANIFPNFIVAKLKHKHKPSNIESRCGLPYLNGMSFKEMRLGTGTVQFWHNSYPWTWHLSQRKSSLCCAAPWDVFLEAFPEKNWILNFSVPN